MGSSLAAVCLGGKNAVNQHFGLLRLFTVCPQQQQRFDLSHISLGLNLTADDGRRQRCFEGVMVRALHRDFFFFTLTMIDPGIKSRAGACIREQPRVLPADRTF